MARRQRTSPSPPPPTHTPPRPALSPFSPLPLAAGRYHLYVSLACPWACRCLAVLHMKGLTDAIGVSVTHPTWQRTRPEDPAGELVSRPGAVAQRDDVACDSAVSWHVVARRAAVGGCCSMPLAEAGPRSALVGRAPLIHPTRTPRLYP